MSGFWRESTVEPKRKFRWILSVGEGQIPAWIIKKVTKPTFTISEVKHSFINHSFYYPGRVEYNEIEFTLVDPVAPDAAQGLINLIEASGYTYPDSEALAKQTITKAEAVEAMNHCYIQQLDAEEPPWKSGTLRTAGSRKLTSAILTTSQTTLTRLPLRCVTTLLKRTYKNFKQLTT